MQAKHPDESHKIETAALLNRSNELDLLFESLYIDKVQGNLSEERFKKLAAKFEGEQKELSEKIELLKTEVGPTNCKKVQPEKFLALTGKYPDVQELTRTAVCELIEKIEIYHVETIDAERVQTLRVHYNHIGYCPIPDMERLELERIIVHPRKGVSLRYLPFDVYGKMKDSR